MSDRAHALDCQCGRVHAAVDTDDDGDDRPATRTQTDLRRARQRARATVRDIQDDVQAYLRDTDVQALITRQSGPERVNQQVTALASDRFRSKLVAWLFDRNRGAAARGIRHAFDLISQELPNRDRDDLFGRPDFGPLDRELVRQIRRIDAGLLAGTETARDAGATDQSLASKLGDRITRALRIGVTNGESVPQLAERVEYVLTDGDSAGREQSGVSGQTTQSKAELIAHDSVQDAYNTAAMDRYKRNGFRYARFDATLDTLTTPLCRRMNDELIDMVDDPQFVPPLHPWCRSGIRPVLQPDDDPLSRDDVADDYLGTIASTRGYRPRPNTAELRPTAFTEQ